jgi:hypothetical protein
MTDLHSWPALLSMALVFCLLLAGGWYWRQSTLSKGRSKAQTQRLEDWPVHAMRPLTQAELEVWHFLRKALPECLLLPQVSMARFLSVAQSRSYSQWFTSIGRRCVDFLICSEQGDVLGVVQLRPSRSKSVSEGTQRKLKTLEFAQIPVWLLAADDLPDTNAMRALVIPELQAAQLHSVQHPDTEWQATRLETRAAPLGERKPEALAPKPGRWNQAWPNEEARSSDFLDEAGMIEIPPLVVKGSGRTARGFTRG